MKKLIGFLFLILLSSQVFAECFNASQTNVEDREYFRQAIDVFNCKAAENVNDTDSELNNIDAFFTLSIALTFVLVFGVFLFSAFLFLFYLWIKKSHAKNEK